MRLRQKLPIVLAAAVVVALTAGPVLADPPAGTTPRVTDAVSTGSDTTQYLFDQFAHDYNSAHPSATNKLFSWDAVNPFSLAIGDSITPKANCTAIARPDGSGAGIVQLDTNTHPSGDGTHFCEDFARSSRGRASTDPPFAPGGIAFVSLAGDAVTWAARSPAAGGTDAPVSLSVAQLVNIYECKVTNWAKVGGKNAPIQAFLPQTSSGTRQFFLTALGGGTTPITPGACVQDGTTSDPNSLEENEGINPLLDSPETIFIYSVGAYISQAYHSPPCTNPDCSPVSAPGTPPCTPETGQNEFGCDVAGILNLFGIEHSEPMEFTTKKVTFPMVPPGGKPKYITKTLPAAPPGKTWTVKPDPKTVPAGVKVTVLDPPGNVLKIGPWNGVPAKDYNIEGTLTDWMGNSTSFEIPVSVTAKDLAVAASTGLTGVTINPNFILGFQRTLYDVVRYDSNTADHIPGSESGSPGGISLEAFFSASGWACTSATAQKDIANYGFLSTWKLSYCGSTG